MSQKLFISKIKVYHTPNGETDYSVGIVIASYLHGNGSINGTYNAKNTKPLMLGFVTSIQKFDNEAAAYAHKAELAKHYRVGFVLPNTWEWGDELTDRPEGMADHVKLHRVVYKGSDIYVPVDEIAAMS